MLNQAARAHAKRMSEKLGHCNGIQKTLEFYLANMAEHEVRQQTGKFAIPLRQLREQQRFKLSDASCRYITTRIQSNLAYIKQIFSGHQLPKSAKQWSCYTKLHQGFILKRASAITECLI